MTLRVPRDRPLPLAGRHTFPAGAVTPDGPGCLLAAPVFARPWEVAPSEVGAQVARASVAVEMRPAFGLRFHGSRGSARVVKGGGL